MEQLEALKEFFRWAMENGPWEGSELDGGDVQDKAEKLGLIVKEPYDPAKHGEPGAPFDYVEVEPGDDWFVYAPGITS